MIQLCYKSESTKRLLQRHSNVGLCCFSRNDWTHHESVGKYADHTTRVGHAILRALEGVNCEELATVLDIRTGDGTSMKNEIEWNLEFCKNELRVIDQNRMNIGGPDAR